MQLFRALRKPANVIMISGVMRSGTTLLQRVLVTADGANPLTPEFRELQKILSKARKQLWDRRRLKAQLRKEIANFWYEQGCPKIVIAKDPLVTDFLKPFTSLLPEVKNVVAVRDPRDTVASILDVRKKIMLNETRAESFLTDMTETGVISYVMQQMHQISKVQNKPNVCIVRYDQLVAKDPELKDRLSDFIGKEIKFDPPDELYVPEGDPFYTPVAGSGLTNERIGRYKGLPPELLSSFQAHRDQMIKLGYHPD